MIQITRIKSRHEKMREEWKKIYHHCICSHKDGDVVSIYIY